MNRSAEVTVCLEIGDRTPGDSAIYPVDDIQAAMGAEGKWQYTHKDGRSIGESPNKCRPREQPQELFAETTNRDLFRGFLVSTIGNVPSRAQAGWIVFARVLRLSAGQTQFDR